VLVPPEDVDALAAAIDGLLDAPAERARLAAGAQSVAERFSLARIAADYGRLIGRVAGKSVPCPS
jgi:glycosyltransferase involved in cell wall biosynthesis